MNRKVYFVPEFSALELELDSSILVGSVTDVKIEIQNVTVQDFADGFSDQGGFKEVSFD